MKNHDFTPKNHIFSNFRGGGPRAGCAPRWIRPCIALFLQYITYKCREHSYYEYTYLLQIHVLITNTHVYKMEKI
jgi:hypothetical protein